MTSRGDWRMRRAAEIRLRAEPCYNGPMRRLLPLLLLVLAACSGQGAAGTIPPPAPTLPTVGELLAAPAPGSITLIGYLLDTPDGAVLVDGLRLMGADAPAPLDAEGIWLGPTPPLGDAVPLTRVGALGYAIVEATGTLEGPGQYGPGGRYRYALGGPAVEARSARELTIPLLLANSALYEGQPVRVRGQLLSSPGAALLVERIGEGGVPDDTALQVKLAVAPRDPVFTATLHRSADGRIGFGPAELTGIWRAGRLYPLAAVPG